MHQSSLHFMEQFCNTYLEPFKGKELTIYDLGSADINGSYRPFFSEETWKYQGIDLAPAKNVDIVLKDPYHWKEISSGSADVFISGQALEHTELFWLVFLEIYRVLKPGGLCCLIAPSSGHEHRFPVDCYRFFPDGFQAVARYASLTTLECRMATGEEGFVDGSAVWKDTVLVARRPQKNFLAEWRTVLRHSLIRAFSRFPDTK